MSVSFNIEQLRAFLRQSKAPEKDAQEAISIFDKCDENKDNTLADDEVPAFKGMCLMKLGFMANSMLRGFLGNIAQSVNQLQFIEEPETETADNPVTEEDKKQYVEVAKEAKQDIMDNIDSMTFPKEVNKEIFLEKLKNYNPENILHLDVHYRFGLRFAEEPSKADIAVAIISDILGMNGDKSDREIKSEITLRNKAVDNVMKMYENDNKMTLRGVKFSEIKKRAEQHENAVDDARAYILKHFDVSGLGKQVEEELFKECLNSITYDIESNGAGRQEDGVLAIETNDNDIEKWNLELGKNAKNKVLARMVKLLIHEAYHLYLDKIGEHGQESTKEEEASAEMLALIATANLCNSDKTLVPFNEYGHSITYYTSKDKVAENPQFDTNFLSDDGYTNHTGTVNEAIEGAKKKIKL